MKQPWLVTGAAGFIGAAVCRALLDSGNAVAGADNLNPYYDPSLKRARLAMLEGRPGFDFTACELADPAAAADLFDRYRPATVVHLAAQPGIARSLTHPGDYIQSNVVVTANVLEQCRRAEVRHLVFASSSSVYGANSSLPFSVTDPAGHPVNLYAATKRAGELMAHSYSHLFGLPVTGLRFFTVYGPWGRPDMAYFRFAAAMTAGEPVTVYGDGEQKRDFTFVDDIVDGVLAAAAQPPAGNPEWDAAAPDPSSSRAPFRLYNIGQGGLVTVNELIEHLEGVLGVKAKRRSAPARAADMPATQAEVADFRQATGSCAVTPFDVGIKSFAEWFLDYYGR